MVHNVFDRRILAWIIAALLLVSVGFDASEVGANASQQPQTRDVVSTELHVSDEHAELILRTDDGTELEIALRDGQIWIDGQATEDYDKELERAWRSLLSKAMETPSNESATLFLDWDAPEGGTEIVDAFAATLIQTELARRPADTLDADAAEVDPVERSASDTRASESEPRSVHGRTEGGGELGERLEARSSHGASTRQAVNDGHSSWMRPFRYLWEGIGGVFQMLALGAVLVGIGFAVVFFDRERLERIADTARASTVRSGLVGLAASFLVLPAYILGMVTLVLTIVGVLLIPLWALLFPVAVGLATLLGYLAVAHAVGEAFAERRFEGEEFYRRANSYYYVLTGVGLLLAVFIAAYVAHMAGPWLGFLKSLIFFIASIVTWAALTIGLGAVLLSRAGTHGAGADGWGASGDVGVDDVDEVFEDGSRV